MPTVDDTLETWSDVSDDEEFDTLLLGNGFSISKHQGFRYDSLLDVGIAEALLTDAAAQLFTYRATSNFEEILQLLMDAHHVDGLLSGTNAHMIDDLAENVRSTLLHAVRHVHVEHRDLTRARLEDIASELRAFRRVFTTNYDLIPYWAFTQRDQDDFYDYFWCGEQCFDEGNTEVHRARADDTALLYLHGAIHLLRRADGTEQKLVGESGARLTNLAAWAPFTDGSKPLFVTEGSAAEKLHRIYASPYLRHVFSAFSQHRGNLLILGHSLSERSDGHLLGPLASWPRCPVAVSVYPPIGSEAIVAFKNRLQHRFMHHELRFFDSTTHPLMSP